MKIQIKSRLLTLLAMLLFNYSLFAETTNFVQDSLLSNMTPVLLDDLDEERGRGGVVDVTTLNNMTVDAVLTDNVAINNITGFNIIDHGSFAGSSGFISVIQNTGNQVVIQDTTIVNVNIIN